MTHYYTTDTIFSCSAITKTTRVALTLGDPQFTLIIYAELVLGSPFSWLIYKISAELHVKQVENYSMKQIITRL